MALPLGLSLLAWLAIAGLVAAGTVGGLVATGKLSVKPGGAGAFYSFPGAGALLSVPSGCQGVTVLGVSQPSFIGTNVAALAGLNWILQFASGGSECFQWGKSSADLASGTGGQVKNGVDFAATNYKEHITYNFAPDGGEVFTFNHWASDRTTTSVLDAGKSVGFYDPQTMNDGWIWVRSGAPLPPCATGPNGEVADAEVILRRGGLGFGFGGSGESFKLWCIKYVQAGATARMDGPGVRHEATFQVSNGKETLTQNLGVDDKSVGAEFRFAGSVQNAATLKMVSVSQAPFALNPNTAGLIGFYDLRGGKWRVVTSGNLMTNYMGNAYTPVKAQIDISNVLKQGASVPDAGDPLITSMNDANTKLYSIPDAKIVTAPGFTETFSGGQAGGRLEYVGPRTFFVTTYQLIVAADWVGVFLPSGKPVIQSVSELNLGIGSTGTVTVAVKNDATVSASFNFDATCSPATVTAINPPRLIPFNPGQAQNQLVTISKGATTEAVDAQCMMRVCDSESPSVCDSRATRVTAQTTGACVPGTQIPTASGIQECGVDGRYRTIASCPLGVEPGATAGTYKCAITGPGTTATPFVQPPTPVPPRGDFVSRGPAIPWFLIAVAGAVIAAVIGVAVVLRRRGPRMPPQRGMPGVR